MPVVEATAVFVASRKDLAKRIEAAMSGAALQCHAEAETDPDEVRARMLAARDKVLKAKR